MVAHIIPPNDLIGHERSPECVCGPTIYSVDPDTGEPYWEPLLVHHSLYKGSDE